MRTHCGGCVSLVIMYLTFIFATLKLQHLMSKHNPSVNYFVERDAFDDSEIWHGDENEDFQLALMVVDFVTGEVKNDPSFVKWYGEIIDSVDGKKTFSEIPMRECNEEDFSKFYEPDQRSAGRAKKYKKQGGFMCVDWSAVKLKGTEFGTDFLTMDFTLLPCNMRETLMGATEDRIPENCNMDQ